MQEASKIDGFLLRDTCISSTHLNRPIGANRDYLHLENWDFQDVLLSKTNSVVTEKQCATCSSF
jgi:hypothetical protein